MTTPDWLTGLLLASRSCTVGCWANATPLWAAADGCVVIESCVAVPAERVMALEIGWLRPDGKNVGEGLRAVPLIGSPLNMASAVALVVAVALVIEEPAGPELASAVTTPPD